MNKILSRDFYLNQIETFINKPIIKVILWQRRVWKSFILLLLIEKLKKNWVNDKEIIYINKEDLKFDNIQNYSDLYETCKNYKYVFIDEIQEIFEWEKTVRSLALENKDIYISWSNSNLLSWELASFLSWRYVSFEIFPLNFIEFLYFHNLEKNTESFEKYMKYGWLPYLVNMNLNDEIYKYLKDIKNTIILKDIIARYKIKNIDFYEKLIEYISKNVWNIFSSNSISNYLKSQKININTNVVVDYLNYTKTAYLVNEVSRYDIKWKKRFEIKHKYFYTDIWIRNSILNGFNIDDISGILENIVFINLKSAWFDILTWEIWAYEIDFIAQKNDKKIYIQVAYLLKDKETIDREFWNLEKITDNYPKYVVSLDEYIWSWINWIIHKNLLDFLSEIYSL